MLGTNNYPFSVLVTNGSSGAFAKNQTLDQLAVGQLGIFDMATNQSVDTTNIASLTEFYLAIGTDFNSTGATTNVLKSAGQKITRNQLVNYSIVCSQNQLPQIVQVNSLTARCDTDYILSIEFRSLNLTRSYGQNFPKIIYSVRTGCCADCAGCSEATTGNELANKLVTAINTDTNALATAQLWDDTNNVAITNLATWMAANPTLTASVRITGIFEQIKNYTYGLLNGIQDTPNGMSMTVSLNSGFECSGVVVEKQALQFARNTGGEVRLLEETARGWSPEFLLYRQTALGTPLLPNPTLTTGAKYFLVVLDYLDNHSGGLTQFTDKVQTIIPVPCAGSTAFMTTLDALVATSGLKALKATADACPSC